MVKTEGSRAWLRNMILSGEYRSGTYMPSVRVLAEQLNISKSSVHNILTMLQEEGLVRLIPGRGAMICSQHPGCPVLQRWRREPECRVYDFLFRLLFHDGSIDHCLQPE